MWWALTILAVIVALHWLSRMGDELRRRKEPWRVGPDSPVGEGEAE